MDDNRITAGHIADLDTCTQDDFSSCLNGPDNRMIQDGDIPMCDKRSFNFRMASDDRIPAVHAKGNAGSRAQFKRSGDTQPSPEMCTGRHGEITVNLHISFEIRPFFCKERITFLDDRWHYSLRIR